MISLRYFPILALLTFVLPALHSQEVFTNETRALLILDISRYVRFEDLTPGNEEFIITLLDKDSNLFFELEKQARTRKEIQGLPIRIKVCTDVEKLEPGQVFL